MLIPRSLSQRWLPLVSRRGKRSQLVEMWLSSRRGVVSACRSVQVCIKGDEAAAHERQVREGVRMLCQRFPGQYWRELDGKREYPSAFVSALQEAGFLSMLIPEEFGGSGLGLAEASWTLEEIHRSGCNGAAAHAQMYTITQSFHFP
jgi:alkylation response protein AidB-like acyl-CoA dehydrogenase